jgi:uncharacterized protein (TIGR03435 family)
MSRMVILAVMAFAISPSAVQLAFEAATIKPHGPDGPAIVVGGSCHGIDSKYDPGPFIPPQGRCVFTRMALINLLGAAYFPAGGISSPRRFTGGPSWAASDTWDVQGKAEDTDGTTEAQLRQMLQALLAERFKLQFHHETAEVQGFALVIGKNGLKIDEETSGESFSMTGRGDIYTFKNAPLSRLVPYLSNQVGAAVVDKTGLTGGYSFSIKMPPRLAAVTDGTANDPGPSIFTILQDEFGLRLEPQKLQMDVVVIDHAEKPME